MEETAFQVDFGEWRYRKGWVAGEERAFQVMGHTVCKVKEQGEAGQERWAKSQKSPNDRPRRLYSIKSGDP